LLFHELILSVMKPLNLERTVSSPYHLIKGKKSGQTIQDVGYYRLHPFFSVLPKLEKSDYDQTVNLLYTDGYLQQNEKYIQLTAKGLEWMPPSSFFDGWKYRGNEQVFFKRLSLLIQTFSHVHQREKKFDPVQNSEEIQLWTKNYLQRIDFRQAEVYGEFKKEVELSLAELPVGDQQKLILTLRLSGFGISGLTWEQISSLTKLDPMDAQLQMVEALHVWMGTLSSIEQPLLFGLLTDLVQVSSLTDSAQRTLKLFNHGYSLQQIADLRRLQASTIEDHFVELAMNDPHFNYEPFVSEEMLNSIQSISSSQSTKRLRDIKTKVPDASYFQIRLSLAIKGGSQ
jgi:uncharacterized protein YpbB